MSNTNIVSGSTRVKGFGLLPKRTVVRSKWEIDVKTFISLFAAVMRQTAAPRCAQRKYLTYIEKQLLNRRSGFLAQTRNYPIFGIRILGSDVTEERRTTLMFNNVKMRKNADDVEFPEFLSWYWNRLWRLRKANPSRELALEVSRILAVLSFAKFLQVDSKRGRLRASNDYIERIKTVNGTLPLKQHMDDKNPLYLDMVKFLKIYGHSNAGKSFKFDRRCYSLKCLTNKRPYRPPVPPAYGFPSLEATFGFKDEHGNPYPNNLVNVIQRMYFDRRSYDAKMTIIAESGGKFRGICPYTSPYAHSVNLYQEARSVLLQIPGVFNYDQATGHYVAGRMSLIDIPKVSADASNFTDTCNIEYLAYMAKALGSHGAVHYHAKFRILDPKGEIHTNCVPLMGWKGTFDLASVLLSYSMWTVLGQPSKYGRIQCGDDFLGYGTLEEYQRGYELIGCKLSEEKTVVSKTVTIFCGEMYWKGLEITPIRFMMTGLSYMNRFIGTVVNRTRDFIDRCNYSSRTKHFIYRKLKDIISRRYKGYLDFRLSSNLGGIQLDLSPPMALVPYLEQRQTRLVHALCNIPYEVEDFCGYSTHFGHLPLGIPYNIGGMKTSLTEGSWPKKSKLSFNRRKRRVKELLSCNRADIADVLLYLYDGTMLKT